LHASVGLQTRAIRAIAQGTDRTPVGVRGLQTAGLKPELVRAAVNRCVRVSRIEVAIGLGETRDRLPAVFRNHDKVVVDVEPLCLR
jgi:hypothetical protein